jgi:thiol-disulfide isomerase/thioredoxin
VTAPEDTKRPRRRGVLIAAAALAGLLAGLGGVYGIAGMTRNPDAALCQDTLDIAKRIAPLAHGEVAALTVASEPLRVPDLAFRDGDGNEHKLSEWHGRTVLLNLWATWCVPCRREMPALDALQTKLGGPGFDVVAVNIDTRNPDKPRSFLRDVGVAKLAYYADPKAEVFQDLKQIGRAFGMPTTMLVGPSGCEIGTMAGPAEWASDDGVKLIEAALSR